eukprot:m.179410 g.179410  ORF g.179410 m.179410 type:complete len:474 (-) comp24535_c0_seq1:25-1446(-)
MASEKGEARPAAGGSGTTTSETNAGIVTTDSGTDQGSGGDGVGGGDGGATGALDTDELPIIDQDSDKFEGWMYQGGPYGVWATARKTGDDAGLTKEIVRAAGHAWAGGYEWGAPNLLHDNVKAYLIWVLERAHCNHHAKRTALRIFSQLPDSCEELFTDLKEVVVQLAEDLAVEMDGHCSREGLRDVLGGLTIPDRDPAAPPLSQALFFAPMSPHVQACLRSLITRLGKHDYENILLRLLILVSHILDPEFNGFVTDIAAWSKVPVKVRDVNPKLFGRMQNKLEADHARDVAANPALGSVAPGALNLDAVRKAVCVETAEEQAQVWETVQAKCPNGVLRVKNLFTSQDSGANGMRFVLVNMPFSSSYVTWSSLLTLHKQLIDRAVSAAWLANVSWASQTQWQETAKVLRALIKEPQFAHKFAHSKISMIVELQLHLEYYVNCRKKTHFWFKLQRADSIAALRSDTAKFRHNND